MSKIRINDLARELEVKSKAILDVLGEVGVTEKKTHSSSVEDLRRPFMHATPFNPARVAGMLGRREEVFAVTVTVLAAKLCNPDLWDLPWRAETVQT